MRYGRRPAAEVRTESTWRDGPIFIGGASRSGKTLLRWMVSSHSRIAISRRTDLWTQVFGRYGDLSRPEDFDRCLDAILERKQLVALEIDRERLVGQFRVGPATYGRLFELIHLQYAARSGKRRWGDQSGLIEVVADTVLAAYPAAKMIQLVRDPRDRHVALATERPDRRSSVGASTSEWNLSVGAAVRTGQSHPERFTVVRYEDLVREPERVMVGLCSFLGEQFEPSMVSLEGVARYQGDPEGGGPITDEYVGVHRGRMDSTDLAFMQRVARSSMAAFGYDPEPVGGIDVRARLRWPLEYAAYGLRRVRDLARLGARTRLGERARR